MRTPIAVIALAAAAVLASIPAAAQEIAAGTRVRITLTPQRDVEGYTPPQVLRGTLVAMDATSMTLQLHPGAGPVRVQRDAVRRVDVSRGVPSRAANAAMGAVGGAVVGALEFWLLNDEEFDSDSEAAWTGAAVGAGFGLVTGALFPRERWKRVRLPDARVSLAPGVEGGTAIAISISR
ncbi:MAG TPA: hypothetical protein VF092_23425 [Longimicrobium sp.]